MSKKKIITDVMKSTAADQSGESSTTPSTSSADGLRAINEGMKESAAKQHEADALDAYVFNYKTVKGEQVRTTLKKCNRNIETFILEQDLLYNFRYNEFADQAEKMDDDGNFHKITDKDLLYLIDKIYTEAEKEDGERKPLTAFKGFDINKAYISDVIISKAKSVNPVKAYFEGLQWDGVPRISTLLHDVFGADKNEYTAEVMRLMLFGILARVYSPGMKFDYMIVLQGRQETGKSSFLKSLAVRPEWYGSIGAAHMSDKKLLGEDAAGKIILEYEELDGITKKTVESLKATITRQTDQYRAAYSVLSEEHPRKYIIAGTTNQSQYLTDETGNRRYLPIPVMQAGFLSPEIVNQVWAEAFRMFTEKKNSGELSRCLYLDKTVNEDANKYREDATRLICDDIMDAIRAYLDSVNLDSGEPLRDVLDPKKILPPKDSVTVLEVFNGVYELSKMPFDKAAKIIRTTLKVLKWETTTQRFGQEVKRVWVRPSTDAAR